MQPIRLKVIWFGVRYPLKMMLLLFYKAAWIIEVYLPAKSANLLNEDLVDFYGICITAVIVD